MEQMVQLLRRYTTYEDHVDEGRSEWVYTQTTIGLVTRCRVAVVVAASP